MRFNYQARDKKGEVKVGVIEASSKEAALTLLQNYGLYVTLLEKTKEGPFYARRIKIFERISQKELVLFSRQLSIMFASKASLVESLRTLASQTKNPDFQEKILKISEEVEGGTSLSSALSKYPKIFSSFYIAMVRAGEASGKLSESLNYLTEHLEREYHLRSRIRGAMIYPAFVLFVVIVVLFLLSFFVIPDLMKILVETKQELPLPTKMVIGFASFLKKWGLILILILLVGIFSLLRYYRTETGKRFFDSLFLKLPLIGQFLKIISLSRFAENLSTLISSGLPIAQCLDMSGKIIGNTVYQEIIFQVRDRVRKGEMISSVLSYFPEVFPPVFTQMVLVGERTGTLDQTLMNLVSFYQKETERNIENLLSILEPALIVFLGLIVGGLMVSLLIPLYRLGGI